MHRPCVGDAAFRLKCSDHFRALKEKGTTIVLVTHDMRAIREFCDRAILLEGGGILAQGGAEEIAAKYFEVLFPKTQAQGLSRCEETDPRLTYLGSWEPRAYHLASGGEFSRAGVPGAVLVKFCGTSLTWIAKTGPGYGIAKVTLDAHEPVLVDLFRFPEEYQQKVWSTGVLPDGAHTVKIECTGTKNPASPGDYVNVDAFEVSGEILAAE